MLFKAASIVICAVVLMFSYVCFVLLLYFVLKLSEASQATTTTDGEDLMKLLEALSNREKTKQREEKEDAKFQDELARALEESKKTAREEAKLRESGKEKTYLDRMAKVVEKFGSFRDLQNFQLLGEMKNVNPDSTLFLGGAGPTGRNSKARKGNEVRRNVPELMLATQSTNDAIVLKIWMDEHKGFFKVFDRRVKKKRMKTYECWDGMRCDVIGIGM